MKLKTPQICLLSLAALAVLGSASQALAFGGKRNENSDYTAKISFSGEVPADQIKMIKQDFVNLKAFVAKEQDAEVIRVMKLRDMSAASLQEWMEDRVQYVIGEKFDLEKSLEVVSESYNYPNPGIFPPMEKGTNSPSKDSTLGADGFHAASNVKTVMTNIGGGLYLLGKMNKALLAMDMDGIGKATATTPRVGIIQIGEGLFRPLLRKSGGTELETIGNSYSRLGTFFHEARHSDGNGKSLVFPHAVCPAGHDYAGYNACDRNLNGPYTVGAMMEGVFAKSCEGCSTEEREALRLSSLDSFARIIKITPKASSASAARELEIAIADLELTVCKFDRAKVASGECAELEAKLQQLRAGNSTTAVEGIPSTEWDDAPEGQR